LWVVYFGEKKVKEFGYFFFKDFSIYLYRNEEHGPYIDSNYMFFNKYWGDEEGSTFMVDLYCKREDYFKYDIASRILQEMVNVLRDIPLYFEEQANKREEENIEEDNGITD
jgi:hypothetical protein